jgi:hypothetical protein
MGASVGAAFFAWINPHLTVRAMFAPEFQFSDFSLCMG